ncbi:universal stress protein [Nocardioides cavernae]|uniref:Universal stress protein n=1 Tax=Nocardioides cavernae TaxID=1921566 RepID=A0ABR8NI59_9ACTN|nr:universal stress protein [Nocardioides cavernae]MBD3927277.1 universal stress protein [Nocardioides cavernae]MBM7513120.1 nucleotide-binding universal stress UspA family protein [Nocardioides cavernae]
MDSRTSGAVVVGVTGRGRETSALRFAAEHARREGARVVLVHVGRVSLPTVPGLVVTPTDAIDVAERIVREVAEELEELVGGPVAHHAVAVTGVPSQVLVELSRDARLVVVQHRTSTALERLFVGSTTNGAAARCHCPLVSVPAGWEPPPGGTAEVVVGVHEAGVPRQVLQAAFSWADRTGAPLRVVHAWRLDAAYDDIITHRVDEEWRATQKRLLSAAVADHRDSWPTVPVEVEVRHQWPADVLVDDSRNASLVVIGRRGARGWIPEHLGSLARTVLRASMCPVMVVPVASDSQPSTDWELTADEVAPQT